MEGPAAEKKTLRQALRAQRAALDTGYRAAAAAAMAEALAASPLWAQASSVFCYVSVGHEPDTHALLRAAWAAGKRVCVPRCAGGGHMEAVPVVDMQALLPAPFGLLEPAADAPALAPGALELVVAPCVAVDKAGWRLGNGGGYYDRFLPQVRCPVVCLCFGRLVLPTLPHGPHDVPVDFILTEAGLCPAPDQTDTTGAPHTGRRQGG